MKKIFKLVKNTEGQALVESALVIFFVLIPLILGMIEFGWILNGKITLTSAAREGARSAVVCEDIAAAETAAVAAVTRSAGASSLSNVVTTVPTFNTTTKVAAVNVTAKVKPIIGLYVKGDVSLTARAEMRIE